MRVLNQITFEAKDDAEALRLASERLGRNAVILSTRTVRVGGFMGFFQRHVLMVSAGILQDEQKEEKPKEKDDIAAKERLVAFQKLLEFKQATETRGGMGEEIAEPSFRQNAVSEDVAKVIYSPVGIDAKGNKNVQKFDSVHISPAGLASVGSVASVGMENTGLQRSLLEENNTVDSLKLKEEVSSLSKRLDAILERLDGTTSGFSGTANVNKDFEAGLPGISVDSVNRGETEILYRRLLSAEIDSAYARQLVEEHQKEHQKNKENVPFEKWFESKIPCAADISSNALGGRRVMLLGPTGVGKTTTIAKLAAIQALWEHKNVLLLTSDTYRIAAVDQLRTYAKILGVPIEVIFEVENFTSILEEHGDADLILLDTAGRGQRDRKSLETLGVIHSVFKPDAVHLVLAANMKYKDMLDVIERMSVVPISHVIFTKLDETVSYGAIFNALKSLDCPVSFFTTGQNVPNDIEIASSARLAGFLLGDESRRSTP
jgi:flagellar biosynthesis protein FlhF